MRKLIAVMLCTLLAPGLFAQAQAPASAVKNSFQDVASHLDSGGNLYLYVSTEEFLTGLSQQISQFGDFFKAIPGMNPRDQQSLTQVVDVVTRLVKNSGVEQVSGFGMSSVAHEKGLYRSRAILHHYKGNDSGYLWSVFGKSPHALDGLDLLPSSTLIASFSDLDLPLLWSTLDKEIGQSGIPGAREAIETLPLQFAAMTGVQFEKALASLGGAYGVVVSLADTGTAGRTAFPGAALLAPESGIMLVFKVKDDTIFDLVDSVLRGNPQVIRTDRGGLRMRTMPTPLPVPIRLRPSIARSGDYLLLASSDALIEAALAAKAGTRPGLKSTDEFKRLSQGVPEQGNSFNFVSQRMPEAIAAVVLSQGAAANRGPNDAAQAQMLLNLIGGGAAGTYNVSANGDEGWISIGNTGQNPAKLVLLPALAVPAILATVAIPSVSRPRPPSNESSAVANLRTINTAEVTYLSSSGGKYGDIPALVRDGLLDSRFNGPVAGYQFTVTVSGLGYTATATSVSSNAGRYGYYSAEDAVVRYSNDPSLAPASQAGRPVQ